jgi:hypothetical protein
MFRLTLSALTLSLLLAGTATAQDKDKPAKEATKADFEKLVKEQIGMLNQMCVLLESVKDKASGEKAVPKLKALAKKGEELKARMEKLGKPSKETEQALKEKYSPEIQKVIPRLVKESTRIGNDPELKKVLEAMRPKAPTKDKVKDKDKPAEKDKSKDK